jgi:hypothetical protein
MSFTGGTATAPVSASRAKLRKRFLIFGIGALALLGPILGVSFLADSGTVNTTITQPSTSSGSLTYTKCPNSTATPVYSPTACTSSTQKAFTLPSWSPTANSSGSVTTAGDLGLIDAKGQSGPVILDVYVTNLQAMALDYSSFAFKINVYQCTASDAVCSSSNWKTITSWDSTTYTSTPYITSSSGFISFSLPGGDWYDVAINTGGEYYCISTSTTSGSLSPTFFLSATAT